MTRSQIVFLIDTNLENCPDLQSSFAGSVCLSCLRLLSHLSARFEKCLMSRKAKHSNMDLKWSFKFFNSKVHHTRIESHKLYDYKLRYFEEFENEIQRRVEQKCTNTQMSSLRPVKAADNISKAFTEILADFKWDSQELLSPVKGKRHRKDVSEQINLVFLFTECPKSFIQLKEFTGKRVPDEEIFLSSLFPNTLLQQFCKTAKLTLHWIDTHHFTYMNASEPAAVDIVRKSVERIGGSLTSMHCFARQGCPYFTDIQCLLEESTCHTKSELPCLSTQLFPLATVTSALSVSGDHTRADRKKLLSKEDTNINIQIGNKILEVSLTSQNVKNRTPQNPGTTGKVWFPYQSCLHAYAVLRKNCLVPSISIESSYLCVQGSGIDARKNNGQILLEMLISQLAARKSVLVLVCSKSGQLVLMEPLTIHAATLSLLSHGTSLSVEKVLLQQAGRAAVQVTDDKNKNCDHMIHTAVDSLHLTKEHEMEGLVSGGSSFDGRQLGGWVVPGCSRTVQKLFTKLNDRLSELDFLSPDEVETLKQLKKIYRAEKQPPGCRDTTVSNTSHTGLESKTGSMEKIETLQKDRTSQVSLSRVDKIICKSKEMVESSSKKKETVCNAGVKVDADKPQLASQLADFKNEDELKNYLTSTYKRLASGEVTDIDGCVQSLTTVALHYFQQKESKTHAKENCRKLLEETLLLSGSQLREKYSQTQAFPLDQRISEYKTQTLIRVDIISSLDEKEKSEGDEIFDEIVGMLRTLSFISEPGFLSKFMQSSFLTNYMHTIPQTLASIYDELMQPLPESLANILSPEDTNQSGLADESFGSDVTIDGPPSARTRSHASVKPQSSQPVNMNLSTTRGGRKLVHHYSMSDFGSKRQIVVDKMPKKQNDKSSKRKRRNSSSKKKNEKVTKSPYHKKRGGVKLQRHQSVAVMQRSHKTPKKNDTSSSRRSAVTPRRQLSQLVAETPSHKQVSSVLNKTLPELSMDVIKESPEKACDMPHGDTPTKGKRAKALLRRSFYSAGPTKRTKNLSQYFQLANRIAGRQPQPAAHPKKQAKLISFETPEHFKSPDKNSSFLLSQLGASPSPAKATPRKLTKTPNKVLDSPCHNTRSKVCQSPSVDTLSRPGYCQASPVAYLKQRSCNKQKSPRVLAAESGVKKGPVISQTTPEKSPALGVVTCGLDSPSQNTRQRLAQTPTRRSVRAALFAKSPVNRSHSPYRATASPRTLLDKFASPVKSGFDKTTPKHRDNYSSQNSENYIYKGTYVNVEPTSTHTARLSAGSMFSLPNTCVVKPDIEVKPSLGSKTPSPSTKKVTKTPESLDKWRRVKSNISQKSPSVNSRKTSVGANPLTECQQNEMNKINRNIMDERNMKDSEYKVKPVKGSFRTKRSLLESPEKSFGSFSKRQRTIDDSCCGSQGFSVTGSQNDLSQSSNASSVDYFSAVNDDVFLSSDTELVDFAGKSETGHVTSVTNRKGLLLSDEYGRSQSPVFGISNRKPSISASVDHEKEFKQKSRRNSGHVSPVRVLKSPSTKKYSPNVSAKSLMHLIQSPLLHSPENKGGRKSTILLSPSSRGVNSKTKGASSRRSLKLNN